MKIELTVPCSVIEEMLYTQYKLDEPVKLTEMEYDELSDICAFTFEVDAENSKRICRDWDVNEFSGALIGEAI